MHVKGIQTFPEVLSPFLRAKLDEAKSTFGPESPEYLSVARQYLKNPAEDILNTWERDRHYKADMSGPDHHGVLKGVERLYQRTILLELTTACFANCRWCLRQNYSRFALKKDQISENIEYFGSSELRDEVNEVLITGGDPITTPARLDYALTLIAERAPNIRTVRVGTRTFSQNPAQIDDDIVRMMCKHRKNFRLEIGTQINSPHEFWPETVEAIVKLQDIGVVFYNQHPLLKGVNDDLEILAMLYDRCRQAGIEAHYLFHCVPMQGMQHHRTTLAKGLELIRRLTACGYFSGRAKPNYAAMTDIGKITFYEGTIVQRNQAANMVQLQSGYLLKDRLQFNPNYQVPDAASVDENGFLRVWYPDGVDDDFWNA